MNLQAQLNQEVDRQNANLPKATLDYNCLVDLEERRPGWEAVREIINLHNQQRVQIIVPGISASERKKGTNGPAHFFHEFTALLDRHGIPRECIVYPIARMDLTYLDACYLAPEDPAFDILEWELHQILHPQVQHNYQAHCKLTGYSGRTVDLKWLNRICDTQAFWCHLVSKADVFVSTDQNFHKETKTPKLIALGAAYIERPADALALILDGRVPDPTKGKVELVATEGRKVLLVPQAYEHYSQWFNNRHTPVPNDQ